MKKRIISAVLTAALLGSSVSSLTCVSAVESDLTPGIESWQEYSGTRKRISGTVEDVIGSLKSGTVVIDCQGAYGDGFLAFTPDERHSYYTKGSKYSIVTMAEGTEPPVKEINEKIGASDNYEVKFYRIDDSDEYGFFVLDKEYKDTVYDLLKHDSNVVKIEECQNILECESALTNFCIKTDLSIDEVYEEYPGLLLENGRALRESDKDWCDAPEDWSYVFSCKVRKDTETYPSFYSSIKKLHDNNVPFRYDVLIATEYGRQQFATSSELIYNAADTSNTVMFGDIYSDGIIDLSDLSTLSLFLVGDTDLEDSQKKAADVDGDSEITLADLARLRQYLSKVILSLDEPPASNTFLFDSYDDLYEALTEQDSSKVFGTDNNGELFDKTIAAFKNNTVDLYVPAIDEDVDVSNIALMTTDLYKLPWIWYHCKASDNDVSVRIAYPGVIENPDLSSAKTYYEVLKMIAPDAPNPDNYANYEAYQKIYESEICLANDKKVGAMISELKDNSKVYVMFNYEGVLVNVYADKSVLTESFWSSFTLAKY